VQVIRAATAYQLQTDNIITPLADEMEETNDRVYVFDLHQFRDDLWVFETRSTEEESGHNMSNMMMQEGPEPTHESGKGYTVVGSKPDCQMVDE